MAIDISIGDFIFTGRDMRIADLDGDGIPDLVTNCYRITDAGCTGRFFHGNGDGTFRRTSLAALGVRGYGETIVVADFDNDGDVDVFVPQYSSFPEGTRTSSSTARRAPSPTSPTPRASASGTARST